MGKYKPLPPQKCIIDGCDNFKKKYSPYCPSCGERRKKERKQKENNKYRTKGPSTSAVWDEIPVCPMCKTPFSRHSGRQIFCSPKCREEARDAGLKYESPFQEMIDEIKPIPFREVKCKCPRCKKIYTKTRLPEGNGTMTWEYCNNCKELNQIASNVEPSFCSVGDIWDD